MAITEYRTRTGVELVVDGVVTGLFFNPLKEVKNRGKNGKEWFPTHIINLVVDGVRVGLGMTDKEVVRIKDADSNYHDLEKGQKISVVITENGEYNGVKQYSGRVGDVILLEAAAQGSQQTHTSAQKAYTPSKKDMSGVHTGHAINVAINVLGDISSSDAIIATAKLAHDVTTRLKQEYSEKNPDMSDYDIGAMVGQSVLSASHYVSEVADIEGYARVTLDTIVPAVSAYVKGEQSAPENKKPAAKKSPVKKAAAKQEDVPPGFEPGDGPPDLEDDIPF